MTSADAQNVIPIKTNFARRFNWVTEKVAPAPKNFTFVFSVKWFTRRILLHQGAYRDRHERGGGMRWPRPLLETSAIGPDGEIVWSWHPSADAKSATQRALRATGQGGRAPGGARGGGGAGARGGPGGGGAGGGGRGRGGARGRG